MQTEEEIKKHLQEKKKKELKTGPKPPFGYAFIDGPETYEACFRENGATVILGGKMEIEFNKQFIDLDNGNRNFFLDYTVDTPTGHAETKTIKLLQEQQRITFSEESILHNPGVSPTTEFQLYTKVNGTDKKDNLKEHQSFSFPSDETFLEFLSPLLSLYDEFMQEEAERFFFESGGQVFKGKDFLLESIKGLFFEPADSQTGHFHEWISAFRKVIMEDIQVEISGSLGYVFEHNLKDWLSQNTGFRA